MIALLCLTAAKLYFIRLTLITDSWNLIFVSSSPLVAKGLDLLLKIPFFSLLFIPWLFLYRRSLITQISLDLDFFDLKIASYNYHQNFQFYHLLTSICATICCVVPFIILITMRGYEFWMNNFEVNTFIAYSWSGGLLFYTMFNLLLYFVLSRVKDINHILRRMLNIENMDSTKTETLQTIQMLSKLHDKLCDVTNNLSTCFAMPVVFIMVHICISQILATFAFIRVCFYHHDPDEFKDSLFILTGTVCYSLLSIVSIGLAGEMKKCSVITWKLIHRMINKTTSVEVEDRLQRLSEQMGHRVPHIDFRFFDVDWALFVKACSESATYLIILIQFDSK
ncbi:uncharacterized protein LOC131288933 [Anopheles ziemanni]|uniref:uncharacterized protein LOC131259948 n=1 Tax=Anopheles coustani TaxID=139045 RepID=UPI002659C4AF|nr:uncharacterized protein LOC131259948 [Anopheles coustani]XP_058174098.1 uncharacterized protein LOC131288933 [Anopheles ziemanni]